MSDSDAELNLSSEVGVSEKDGGWRDARNSWLSG